MSKQSNPNRIGAELQDEFRCGYTYLDDFDRRDSLPLSLAVLEDEHEDALVNLEVSGYMDDFLTDEELAEVDAMCLEGKKWVETFEREQIAFEKGYGIVGLEPIPD